MARSKLQAQALALVEMAILAGVKHDVSLPLGNIKTALSSIGTHIQSSEIQERERGGGY